MNFMEFQQNSFHQFLLENKVVGFFEKPITLKSGRQSSWYVNWRKVAGDVYLLDRLADFVLAFVKTKHLDPDVFYGVPEGATKLGLIATYKWAKDQSTFAAGSHAFPMGRAKPKEHGDPADRFFVGAPRGRVVVLEDVTTTGGSLLETLAFLAEAKVNVIAAIGVTNRGEQRADGKTVTEALAEKGIPYLAMSEAKDFLREAVQFIKPPEALIQSVEAEIGASLR
ncbi:MAG: hypothetical protein HY540_03175 [Deltaproteobacteria bacterium]|nr:hypothetical protein [Deltaproteobacteria bacterium]